MHNEVGIWIDLNHAVVVHFRGDSILVTHVPSSINAKHRSTGGVSSPWPWWRRSSLSGRRAQEHRANEVRAYFKTVAEAAHGARVVLLCGPGEAKVHLQHYLTEIGWPGVPSAHLKTTNSRLTEGEIVAYVKESCGRESARWHSRTESAQSSH